MRKHYIIIFFVIVFNLSSSVSLNAQVNWQVKIDSMLIELGRAKEDTNKVWLLCEISNACLQLQSKDIMKYAKLAQSLAEKLKWQKGISRSWGGLASANILEANYMEAEKCRLLQFAAAQKTNDPNLIYKSQMGLIDIYSMQKKYFNAINLLENLIKTEKERGNDSLLVIHYYNLADIYWGLNEYSKANKYLQKALDYFHMPSNSNLKLESFILSDMAVCYQRLNQNSKAIEYSFLGIKKAKQIKFKWVETNLYGNLALVYAKLKNYPLAIKCASKSLDMAKEMKDSNLIAVAMLETGNAYLLMVQDTAKAIYFFEADNNEHESMLNNVVFIPASKTARIKLSLDYLHKALFLKEKLVDIELKQHLYQDLAIAHKLSGDYKAAFEYHEMFTKLQDSMAKKEHEIDLESKLVQRNFEKQKAEADTELQRQKTMRNSFIIGFAVMLLFAGVFFSQRNKIKKGKKRSDELLLNILPEEVAEELKLKGSANPKYFDDVTVMFTDFKGFTQISEKLTPNELVNEIHTCFKAFDEIVEKHNIEKIKTIGDAYMCAGGLPVINSTHASDVLKAAIEIQQFMIQHIEEKKRQGQEPFEIRIGVHTGKVVAGIVGVKKFAYDIWGDTVNTASRMESTSEAGEINISGTTYNLVKNEFKCKHRGKITAKGKGEVDMYFVEGKI